ncbi:hypothetical protein, partial [Burkholderia sp. Ac-20384]|uniref:hypothetical protein n=1 Tax=Burkholderia sp. Ac-20384 TaxID=2703902 RepID=UPI0019804F75
SGILMGVHPAGFLEGWVFGDFQSPRLSPDEPSIQPIEASQLARRDARASHPIGDRIDHRAGRLAAATEQG